MKKFLGIIAILGLAGFAYSMGSSGGTAPAGDPFEGFDLDFKARKNIGLTCSEDYGQDEPPSRSCVEVQVAALRTYQRMRDTYPRDSKGAKALKRCWADPGRAKRTDYVAVVDCAEKKIGRI